MSTKVNRDSESLDEGDLCRLAGQDVFALDTMLLMRSDKDGGRKLRDLIGPEVVGFPCKLVNDSCTHTIRSPVS